MSDISTNLLCMHVTYGRGSGNVTIRYTSGFNGNVIFARNGVMSLRRRCRLTPLLRRSGCDMS